MYYAKIGDTYLTLAKTLQAAKRQAEKLGCDTIYKTRKIDRVGRYNAMIQVAIKGQWYIDQHTKTSAWIKDEQVIGHVPASVYP